MNKLREKKLRTKLGPQIKAYTNGQLLDEALFAASGDDYDGCFTDAGEIEFNMIVAELESRLSDWIAVDKPPTYVYTILKGK